MVAHGFRIIAMSRFGYLRTPLPADASAEAQADAGVSRTGSLRATRQCGSTCHQFRRHDTFVQYRLEIRFSVVGGDPIGARRLGLINDATVTSQLPRYPLERIQSPSLLVSCEDDQFGTHAPAAYSAQHIAGAEFVSYPDGDHLLVGHFADFEQTLVWFLNSTHR
jgi:pimeloyl-ACP methyl ester carboxylesterase